MYITVLKRVGRYLLKTSEKRIILQHKLESLTDCNVDANFAILWNHEDPTEDNSVESITGYVICFRNCPSLWSSCLQEGIVFSTLETKFVA